MKNGYEEELEMVNGIYGDVNHEVLKSLNSIIKVAYEDGFRDGKAHKAKGEQATESLNRVMSKLAAKSPNQQRAELIQRAREFVGKEVYRRRQLCGLSGNQISFDHRFCQLEFVVNAEKRTVVALIKSLHGKRIYKGIAKCMPGEVFNEVIGKAIALARALEIDIPQEFMQAVQPTKVVKGMVLRTLAGPFAITSDNPIALLKSELIFDDTNAIYEEPK